MRPAWEGGTLHLDIPPELASLDGVRSQVVAAAGAWGFPALQDLALVTSEIVTNAIRHAGTPAHLTCRLVAPDEVELAVTDHGAGQPEVQAPDARQPGGRGLQIVAAISAAWGVEHATPGATTVWARVRP